MPLKTVVIEGTRDPIDTVAHSSSALAAAGAFAADFHLPNEWAFLKNGRQYFRV